MAPSRRAGRVTHIRRERASVSFTLDPAWREAEDDPAARIRYRVPRAKFDPRIREGDIIRATIPDGPEFSLDADGTRYYPYGRWHIADQNKRHGDRG